MNEFYFGGGGGGVLNQPVAPQAVNLQSLFPGLLLFAAVLWAWRKIK